MYTEMKTNPNDRRQGSACEQSESGRTSSQIPWDVEAVIVGAESRELLVERLEQLQAAIAENTEARLVDIAATLNTQTQPSQCRIALVAASVEELGKRIERALVRLSADECPFINDAAGIYYFSKPLYQKGAVAFLFPGEGAQYLSMLGDLCTHFPEMDRCLQLADEAFTRHDPDARPISEFVHFPKDADPEDAESARQELGRLDSTMVSVLFADWAMNELLTSLQIEADVIAGHSAGELAALGAAKSMPGEDQAVNVVGMMQALRNQDSGDGQRFVLLAVGASREVVAETIEKVIPKVPTDSELHLAMDNCPHQTVLVGTSEAMEAVVDELTAAKVMHEKLPFDRPYHTYLFEPYLEDLSKYFAEVPFRTPEATVYSCTTAQPFPNDPDQIRDLALSHWASRVRFTDMIRQMHDDGVRIFIEAGPRGNLSSFATDILRGEEFLAVAANVQRRSGTMQLNHLVAQLAAHHVPMQLGHLYERREHSEFIWQAKEPATKQENAARPTKTSERLAAMPPTVPEVPSSSASRARPELPIPQSKPVADLPPASSSAGSTSHVMNRYMSVMEQFLGDQEAVTKAYLQQKRTGQRVSRKVPRTSKQSIRPTGGTQPAPALRTPQAVPSTPPHGPLIGEIIDHQPGKSLVMRRRLDLQEDIYAGEHTVGGRDVSKVDPAHHGLPVMPMTFNLEMMAEIGTLLIPGFVVAAIRDVQLQRWLDFDAGDVGLIQVSATLLEEPLPAGELKGAKLIRVEVRDLGSAHDPDAEGAGASAGTVVMTPGYPAAPKPKSKPLTDAHPSRPSLEQVYKSLFHGPLFQGVVSLDICGDEGVDATIRVLPREGLLRSNDHPNFIFDPVFIDVSMHPTVAWHLEQPDQSGRILLPYEMKRIEFFGPCPTVGAEFTNRSRVAHASARQFHQDGEILDSNGNVWSRLLGVRSWRFYLPFGEVNFNGPKDEYFLTKDWPEAMPDSTEQPPEEEPSAFGGNEATGDPKNWCVRFSPSADLMQPALQSAAAQVTLSKRERQIHRDLRASDAERSKWLFSRVAAKDAARILWRFHHAERLFPADIEIESDDLGCFRATPCGSHRPTEIPKVSFAAADDFMVAAASLGSPVGVAIQKIEADDHALDEDIQAAVEGTSEAESNLGAKLQAARWAVAKALGSQVVRDTRQLTIGRWDSAGNVYVAPDTRLCTSYPEFLGKRIVVRTFPCKDMIIATTLGQCEAPD